MSGQDEAIAVGGVKLQIPPEERTPLIEQLLRMIHQQQQEIETLREEIRRLKGLPETPKRTPQPSTLNDPEGKPSRKNKKSKKGKRPGSQKKKKKLDIHETVKLELEDLPEGTRLHGFEDFLIQDLVIRSHNIRYRRARYQLTDGSWLTARCRRMSSRTLGPICEVTSSISIITTTSPSRCCLKSCGSSAWTSPPDKSIVC